MHKITGRFDTKHFSLVLDFSKEVEKEAEMYDIIKQYYINNMFMRYARRAPNFQRIVISSIGDHLDRNEEQDFTKADLFLDIEIGDKVSKTLQDILNKAPNWFIELNLNENNKPREQFYILIRKCDEMIIRPGE